MAKGSRYWANSYVILTSGKKLYLENSEYEIKEKIRSNARIIKLRIATWLSDETINIDKNCISCYGKI